MSKHHELDTTSQFLTQPKSNTQFAVEGIVATAALCLGVATAAYVKPRKSDWDNKEDDVKNSLKTGAAVGAVIIGTGAMIGLAAKSILNPTVLVPNPNYIEEEEEETTQNAG